MLSKNLFWEILLLHHQDDYFRNDVSCAFLFLFFFYLSHNVRMIYILLTVGVDIFDNVYFYNSRGSTYYVLTIT